jgi:hypothetical protein
MTVERGGNMPSASPRASALVPTQSLSKIGRAAAMAVTPKNPMSNPGLPGILQSFAAPAPGILTLQSAFPFLHLNLLHPGSSPAPAQPLYEKTPH